MPNSQSAACPVADRTPWGAKGCGGREFGRPRRCKRCVLCLLGRNWVRFVKPPERVILARVGAELGSFGFLKADHFTALTFDYETCSGDRRGQHALGPGGGMR